MFRHDAWPAAENLPCAMHGTCQWYLMGVSRVRFVQANELELALDVYGQLLREGCTPNLVTYNILIDIHGKMGNWQEAVQVLDALEGQVSASPSSPILWMRSHAPAAHVCTSHCSGRQAAVKQWKGLSCEES